MVNFVMCDRIVWFRAENSTVGLDKALMRIGMPSLVKDACLITVIWVVRQMATTRDAVFVFKMMNVIATSYGFCFKNSNVRAHSQFPRIHPIVRQVR